MNVPLSKLAFRLAVTASEGDGFIRNSIDGRTFAEQDYVGARMSLRAQPGDRSSLHVVAQRVTDNGASSDGCRRKIISRTRKISGSQR